MTQGEDIGTPGLAAWSRAWAGAPLLLVLAILAYLPATRCGFIWDDDLHLTANPCVVGPLGLKEIWTTKEASLCPLVLTTFWVEHRLWGLNPWPYHAVNVLMHAGAALVLWRVLLVLKVPGAWLGAALWALHPVQVASVAWITEMKNTQSGLFFLLSILFYCKWRRGRRGDKRKRRLAVYYGLTLFFGTLALASKSSTVVLPLVLGVCAWWMEGRWNWRRDLIELMPLLLLSVLAGVLTMWTQGLEGAEWRDELALSGPQRMIVAGRALWFYLGKLLWPHPLVMIYPRWEVGAANALGWLPVIAAVAMTVLLWRNRNGWNGWGRALWAGWTYFGLALLPVLGLVTQNYHHYSYVADHFQYLAGIGPLALAGAGIAIMLDGLKKPEPWLKAAVYSGVLLVLGVLSWRQCAMYQSQEVLWTATLRENPSSSVGHNNLGNALQQKGRLDEAVIHYHKALEITPNDVTALNNLGSALQRQGRLDDAVLNHRKALAIKPDDAATLNNLGFALQQKGLLDEAMGCYQRALQIKPGFGSAHYNLGLALQNLGELDKAMECYRQALRFQPGHADAHNNLGLALQQKGELEQAIVHYRRALELNPEYPEARYNFGNALLQQGHPDLAIAEYEKALEINPGFSLARNNLGLVLQQGGRLEEARDQYRKVLETNPDHIEVLTNLAWLLGTAENVALRDGAKAAELAWRAERLTSGSRPVVLGALAAAYAEMGNFSGAAETAQRAIRLAETQGNSGLVSLLQQHLKRYQDGQPLRGL